MRKRIVAGNWKMNMDQSMGKRLVLEVMQKAKTIPSDVTLVIAPSFPHLGYAHELVNGNVVLGAQNANNHLKGAYTGEVSAEMLKSFGVTYVILGHSERRQYFYESDNLLAEKVDQALAHDLLPIFCCGETLKQRESANFVEVVAAQLTAGLFHLSPEDFSKIVIAYEPIWAIGTGVTATSDQAQQMHAALRSHVAEKYGNKIASNLTILYGGSCKPTNAQELFACPDVDGGLIGGASLKADDFIAIANSY